MIKRPLHQTVTTATTATTANGGESFSRVHGRANESATPHRLRASRVGATDWTRTSTALLPTGPKPVASTNFATVADPRSCLFYVKTSSPSQACSKSFQHQRAPSWSCPQTHASPSANSPPSRARDFDGHQSVGHAPLMGAQSPHATRSLQVTIGG